VWFKANFPVPRHSHSGDCLYYVISGSAIMGSRTLRAGDSFFVPSGAPYQYTAGPEGVEVLEIRHRVDHVDFTFHDPDAYGEKAAKAIEANRESWVTTTVSPTFAANAR
jgi:quercetin dioxygenase-like cupin family protein